MEEKLEKNVKKAGVTAIMAEEDEKLMWHLSPPCLVPLHIPVPLRES